MVSSRGASESGEASTPASAAPVSLGSPTAGSPPPPKDAEPGTLSLAERKKRAIAAFLAGHMLAYPVAFVWAIFAIVPILSAIPPQVLATKTPESAARLVILKLAWPSIALFVLVHGGALPWALDRRAGSRGIRISLATYGVLMLVGGLFAVGVWVRLYTR